jgi:predicted TIM-barrel fold metal-dependent hydrolase
MAYKGLKVMDSDMHVMEPGDLWQRYMDPKYREIAPASPQNVFHPRLHGVEMPGKQLTSPLVGLKWFGPLVQHMEPQMADYAVAVKLNWDGVSQLHAMDKEGIDIAFQYPTKGLAVLGIDSTEFVGERGIDPAFAVAIARAYNDWMYDFCAPDPKRLIGIAMVAPHDVDAAVAETRRCVGQLGFKGIFLLPGLIKGRAWHHPDYDPLWAECERLDIAVGFHGGVPDQLTDFGLGLTESLMMRHTFSHCLGPMAAGVSLCSGGVFDRFPKLRVGLLEANCSWAPWLLGRLDDHYQDYTGRFEIKLSKKPSDYFRSNCFVSVEPEEHAVKNFVEWYGDNNVVFSTDYPHPDSRFPHAVELFMKLPLTDTARRKFLWDNCARLYGM